MIGTIIGLELPSVPPAEPEGCQNSDSSPNWGFDTPHALGGRPERSRARTVCSASAP
jgi:hypothetical protein